MSIWIFGRRTPREGERVMPASLPELDAYVQQQIDWWLVHEDLTVCAMPLFRNLVDEAGFEIVDDAYRRAIVVRRKSNL